MSGHLSYLIPTFTKFTSLKCTRYSAISKLSLMADLQGRGWMLQKRHPQGKLASTSELNRCSSLARGILRYGESLHPELVKTPNHWQSRRTDEDS